MYEFLFALFLFSYQFKNAHFMPAELDLTIITAAILLPYSIFIILMNRKKLILQDSCWFSLAFVLYALFSVMWGFEGFFVTRKAIIFAVFTAPALFITRYIIAEHEARVKSFFYSILFLATITTFESYRVLFTSPNDIVTILGNNYLVAGNTIGLGILFSLGLLKNQKSKAVLFLLQSLTGAMFVASLYLGGRGPVISLVIALSVLGWLSYQSKGISCIKEYLPIAFCSLAFWLLIKTQSSVEQSELTKRVSEIITADGSVDKSLGLRFEYYKSAWQAFVEHPWKGLGFGSWPQYFGIGDVEYHPHNLVLEILSELGIIGILIFVAAIFEMLRIVEWRKIGELNPATIACISALVFTGLNAMKSGDINDNSILFVVFAIMVGALKKEAY